jgi:hypothetical protein
MKPSGLIKHENCIDVAFKLLHKKWNSQKQLWEFQGMWFNIHAHRNGWSNCPYKIGYGWFYVKPSDLRRWKPYYVELFDPSKWGGEEE